MFIDLTLYVVKGLTKVNVLMIYSFFLWFLSFSFIFKYTIRVVPDEPIQC